MLLSLPPASSPDPVLSSLRSLLARGRYLEAERLARSQRRHLRPGSSSWFLAHRAEIALGLGRFALAWEFASEAALRPAAPGRLPLAIEGLKIRALLGLGRFKEAERAVDSRVAPGDSDSIDLHFFRAQVALHSGRLPEAAQAADRACARAVLGGRRLRLVEVLQLKARIAREVGNVPSARLDLDRAVRACHGLRDSSVLAAVLSDRSDLMAHGGEWEKAALDARKSACLFARSLSPHEHLTAGRRAGLLGLAQGDPAVALPAIERAADVARRGFGTTECRADIDLLLADAQLAGHDPEGALERASAALAYFSDSQDPRGLARARVRRSLAALSAGNRTLALREAKMAGSIPGAGPVAEGLADLALGRVLLRSNRETAAEPFERASKNLSLYPPLRSVARLGLALSGGASGGSDTIRSLQRVIEDFGDRRILGIVRADLKEAFGVEPAAVFVLPVDSGAGPQLPDRGGEGCGPEFLPGLLGVCAAVRELGERIRKAAPSDLPVSIYGETGTGKEKIARAVHHYSQRAAREFVAINAASLSDELFESGLFGHTRGSFTGAHADRPGLVEQARGGTLFIDEIADLSTRAQVRLLRFLEDGTYRRVGDNHERRADVRIVVAANRPLEALVVSGAFRRDLLERIKGLGVTVPPLRERGHDVLHLARHFVQRASGGGKRLSRRAEAELSAYAWPGNVRELDMEMRRAVVLADGSEVEWRKPRETTAPFAPSSAPLSESGLSLREAMGGYERRYLKAVLSRCVQRVEAARLLGISRQALHQKIVQYGL